MVKWIRAESNSNRINGIRKSRQVLSSRVRGQRSQGQLWEGWQTQTELPEVSRQTSARNWILNSTRSAGRDMLRHVKPQQIWDEKCVTPSGGQDGDAGGDKTIPGKSWQWEIPAQMYKSTAIKKGLLNHHRWKRKMLIPGKRNNHSASALKAQIHLSTESKKAGERGGSARGKEQDKVK